MKDREDQGIQKTKLLSYWNNWHWCIVQISNVGGR